MESLVLAVKNALHAELNIGWGKSKGEILPFTKSVTLTFNILIHPAYDLCDLMTDPVDLTIISLFGSHLLVLKW